MIFFLVKVCLLFAGLPYMLDQIKEVSPIKDLRMVKAVDPNAVAVDTKSKTNISTIKSFAEETLSILDENKLSNKKIAVVGINNMSIFIYNHLKEYLLMVGGLMKEKKFLNLWAML